MNWLNKIGERIVEAFHGEKRQTKFAVVTVLLILTCADWYRYGARIEIWAWWFGLIGYDGHRTLQEKKLETKKQNTNEAQTN